MGGMWLRCWRRLACVVLVVCAAAAWSVTSRSAATAQSAPTATIAAAGGDSPGRTIYLARCAECHGESGRGDGPAALFVTPRPRNFVAAKYKIRTTAGESLPTDADLIRAIAEGMPGSTMPGWKGLLSDEEIRTVTAYVKSLSPLFAKEAPQPILVGATVPNSPASVARGATLYDKLQCSRCHGTDGRGAGVSATEFTDDEGAPLPPADLTAPWTFHGGAEARDVFMRLRTGLRGTPMQSFAGIASEAETWDLANYVLSLQRKPLWKMNAEEAISYYAALDAEDRANPARRGQYLVETMGCALCHSPADERGAILPGMKLAGGLRIRIEPFGDYPTGNLTSDKETGLGNWSDTDIKQVLTRGTLPDGTRMLPYPMDWPSYSTMNPEDIDAIVKYLRTIPPVKNKVPRPSRTALPAYLWGKFTMLILGTDQPMRFYPGNAGDASGGRP